MDIRNVQKTGNMHYMYLPTSWCKKYGISSDTKVSIEAGHDGTLTISPEIRPKKQADINIEVSDEDQEIIIKLIMACYVNPSQSFKIHLKKETNVTKLLDQKNLISGFEFVELDGNTITYESSISINEPYSLLRTMSKKIKNMLNIMISKYNNDLIQKYEEEIDRSRLMINKSVNEALILHHPTKLKTIDLHYISHLAQYFERLVDSLILLDKSEAHFFRQLDGVFGQIKDLLEDIDILDYTKAIALAKSVQKVKEKRVDTVEAYCKNVIRNNLVSISEIILNWSITKEIDG